MPIHVALTHRTTYQYDRPTVHGPHVVRLRPAPHCRTPILAYSLKVEGGEHFLNWQQDPFANYLARLNFEKPLTELTIEVDLVAELAVFNPFDFFLETYAENFPFSYDEATAKELGPFLEKSTSGLAFGTYHESIDRTPRRTIEYPSRATPPWASASRWIPCLGFPRPTIRTFPASTPPFSSRPSPRQSRRLVSTPLPPPPHRP